MICAARDEDLTPPGKLIVVSKKNKNGTASAERGEKGGSADADTQLLYTMLIDAIESRLDKSERNVRDDMSSKIENLAGRVDQALSTLIYRVDALEKKVEDQARDVDRLHDDAHRLQPLAPPEPGWVERPVATSNTPESLQDGRALVSAGHENTSMPLRRSSRYV